MCSIGTEEKQKRKFNRQFPYFIIHNYSFSHELYYIQSMVCRNQSKIFLNYNSEYEVHAHRSLYKTTYKFLFINFVVNSYTRFVFRRNGNSLRFFPFFFYCTYSIFEQIVKVNRLKKHESAYAHRCDEKSDVNDRIMTGI